MKLSLSRSILALLVGAWASNAANPDQPCETFYQVDYKSGDTDKASHTFVQEGASFIQLDLTGTKLAPGAQLVLSGESGEEWLDSKSIGDFSAELDGSKVTLELTTSPGGEKAEKSSIVVNQIKAGICDDDPNAATICGPTDDRTPSTDDRQGRMNRCTAWLIGPDAFVWAGHCGTPYSFTRLHFTYGAGSAPPDKQYAVDVGSYTGVNGGVGNDWGVGKLLRNSQTNLLPGDAQGGWYNIGTVPTTTACQHIRITGYGVASATSWSQSQTTHTGDLVAINSNNLRYMPDTMGGNSGSPVVHEETGDAIGVHTQGGCTSSGGSNIGTSIANAAFKAAVDAVATPLNALCMECTNKKTRWMKKRGKTCWTAARVIERKCNESERWVENGYCERACFAAGRGYDGVECCEAGGLGAERFRCKSNCMPWEHGCRTYIMGHGDKRRRVLRGRRPRRGEVPL